MAWLGSPGSGVYGYIGLSGSGKSYAQEQDTFLALAKYQRQVLRFDVVKECSDKPIGVKTKIYYDLEKAIEDLSNGTIQYAIVRGALNTSRVERAAEWAVASRGIVAVSEAHRAFPTSMHELPTSLDALVTAWRHHDCGLYWDSQRIARVSRTVTEQTANLHVFATIGDADLKRLREYGKGLEEKAIEAAALMDKGEPGYHVALGMNRVPPYELVRR